MTGTEQKSSSEKLQLLREKLQQRGLQAYMVPRADEWQGEYVPARAERLPWLTGFSGSAGTALIAEQKAAVYSDSRYTLQMDEEVDGALYDRETGSAKNKPENWFLDNLQEGDKIGYDPRLHTIKSIETLQKKLDEKNIELVAVADNLVDAIWDDQPEHPLDPVVAYPESYAGKSSADKREEIAAFVREADASAVLLTAPDSIMWLLNVRGTDVPNTPFALSYAIVRNDGEVEWFIPAQKITPEIRQHVGNHVHIHEFDDMTAVLKALDEDGVLLMDEATTPIWFTQVLADSGITVTYQDDPVTEPKAIKNETERLGIIEAHRKDGVALVKFWKWIDDNAPQGSLTEIDAVEKLESLRQEQGALENSFDAIVGWEGNGAIVHYRVDEESNKTITGDSLLLVDSGAQYIEGTTDNTRTRAVGTPSAEMRENFTRVLKGHIAIADAHFGEGTTGRDIDMLARQFLRKVGRDYGHGTGHGVGAYLSVHEGGAGISARFEKLLKPGMLISNEPGFYKAGEYGIRIENLVFVEETGDEDLKYKFNTVSLTPIDLKLIDVDLLDADEIRWLNEYHQRVYDELSPHLDEDEKKWLKKETAPLARNLQP